MRDARFVKPAVEGTKVPDPDHGGNLPRWGASVNWSPYWERQLQDKSIVVTDAPSGAPKSDDVVESHGARRTGG